MNGEKKRGSAVRTGESPFQSGVSLPINPSRVIQLPVTKCEPTALCWYVKTGGSAVQSDLCGFENRTPPSPRNNPCVTEKYPNVPYKDE